MIKRDDTKFVEDTLNAGKPLPPGTYVVRRTIILR